MKRVCFLLNLVKVIKIWFESKTKTTKHFRTERVVLQATIVYIPRREESGKTEIVGVHDYHDYYYYYYFCREVWNHELTPVGVQTRGLDTNEYKSTWLPKLRWWCKWDTEGLYWFGPRMPYIQCDRGFCITLHPKVLVVGGTSRLRERTKSQVST